MVEYTNDLQHTAVHEAGHAVIARVLDMACGGATIVADEDEGSAGHAETFDPHVTAHAWDLRGHLRDIVRRHRSPPSRLLSRPIERF